MSIKVPPGTTSYKRHFIINDTTGTFLIGNWTASGATLAYNIGESATWTKVTIGQGTEGTYSSGTICDSASSSTSPVVGVIQVCMPDASIPASFDQRVDFILQFGTASGSRAMYPIKWTLQGAEYNSTGYVITSAGTITLVNTLTTYTGNTPQTGDAFARIGTAGVGLTNLGDTRIAHLDADVSSRMATYVQPTGFLSATFPSGTIANTTNITAATGVDVTKITGMDISFTGNTMTAGTQQINTNAALLGGVATTLGLVSGGLSFNGTNSMFDTNFYVEGPAVMDIQTASYDYRFLVLVKNQQGQLVDPDTNTIGTDASNDAGVSRNAGLSLVGGVRKCVRESTGRYTCTYTVAPSDAVETIRINFNGTATNAGITFGRYSSIVSAVVDPASSGGGLTAQQVADALKLAPTAGSPAAGSVYDDLNTIITSIAGFTFSGAYTRGFHVQDTATNSIQSAIVRIQLNTNAEYHVTPASGNFTTSLDAHTYTLTATCPGFAGYANTLTVSADGAFTIVMTALTPPVPSNPSDCTIYFYTVDQAGTIATGTNVAWELSNPEDDTVVASGTSNSNAVTALWSLDVRIPATGTTYVRVTTPTRNFDAAIPYTTTPGSSLKIAGP